MKAIDAILLTAAALLAACRPSQQNDLPRGKASAELSAAVDAFYEATQTEPKGRDHITLHSIMVLKHGKVVEERWYNGQSADMPHMMWSVSKTFTATAIGFAIEEGLLTLDDTMISFFPDKLPQEVSENLAAITVRDLLTMTCGHDVAINFNTFQSDDWVRGFIEFPVLQCNRPGIFINQRVGYVYAAAAGILPEKLGRILRGEYIVAGIVRRIRKIDSRDFEFN